MILTLILGFMAAWIAFCAWFFLKGPGSKWPPSP
jgi:hypothetical protein